MPVLLSLLSLPPPCWDPPLTHAGLSNHTHQHILNNIYVWNVLVCECLQCVCSFLPIKFIRCVHMYCTHTHTLTPSLSLRVSAAATSNGGVGVVLRPQDRTARDRAVQSSLRRSRNLDRTGESLFIYQCGFHSNLSLENPSLSFSLSLQLIWSLSRGRRS